jgi:translation initiation factor IF-1
LTILETIGSVSLGDEIINECGICQSCFVKFNEYDEHISVAEQIQSELLGLMDNKFAMAAEEEYLEDIAKAEEMSIIKEEEALSEDTIEFEPFEATEEELFLKPEDDTEEEIEGAVVETIGEDCHYEIIVDDTKENKHRKTATVTKSKTKLENADILMIETDDHQKMYQCDICLKTCKDKSKLRSHREIHTDERNVICPVRPNNFRILKLQQ